MSRQLFSASPESSDLVQELERSYRERISTIDFKSRQGQSNYEALEESLRRQLNSLREEIDMKSLKSSKIVSTKRSSLDSSLQSLQSEKEKDIQESLRRLSQTKDKYFRSKQEFDLTKSKLLSEKAEYEIENKKLRSVTSDLSHEIELIQSKLREIYHKDIHFAKKDIEGLKESFDNSLRRTSQDQNNECRDLEFRIENTERMIENLEYDINSMRKEEEAVKQQTERDLAYLRESIMDSNREIEHCEEQMVGLLRTRDEAKEDSLMFSKITGELETELGKEMKTNTRLVGKLSKLERLVYGKGARSPSKARLN